ncbi:hypothetical protein KR222_004933, partial [Zaprionus bogoriensis]
TMQMTEKPEKDSPAVVLDIEANDRKNIGWNLQNDPAIPVPSYLAEVQVSHKQITDRFVELLNLFEDYSRIMESEQAHYNPQSKLKRTQSEQFTAAHTQDDCNDLVKASISLNRMQLSDSTILAFSSKLTCDAAIQTSWKTLPASVKNKEPQLAQPESHKANAKSAPCVDQQTLLIEVESVTSTSALQRAPLRQRMWQVLVEAWQSLVACFYMMGENFTYVLFVLLCLWCLYLIIAHYYSFLGTSLSQQQGLKHSLNPGRA